MKLDECVIICSLARLKKDGVLARCCGVIKVHHRFQTRNSTKGLHYPRVIRDARSVEIKTGVIGVDGKRARSGIENDLGEIDPFLRDGSDG